MDTGDVQRIVDPQLALEDDVEAEAGEATDETNDRRRMCVDEARRRGDPLNHFMGCGRGWRAGFGLGRGRGLPLAKITMYAGQRTTTRKMLPI